jgi:hypothetical protein
VLQCYGRVTRIVTVYSGVGGVIDVTVVFWWCYSGVTGMSQLALVVLQWCYNYVSSGLPL